jgi:apolipoprotein N-acyltransferase
MQPVLDQNKCAINTNAWAWRGVDLATIVQKLTAVAAVVLSATLSVLSLSVPGLGWVAWFALVPAFFVLSTQNRKRSSFGLGFVLGLGIILGCLHPILVIEDVSLGDYLLIGSFVAIYYGVFGLSVPLFVRTGSRFASLTIPALWVILEYTRIHSGFLSLPIGLLGYSQYQYPPVIQIASITGVYGVSFVLVMVNYALSESLRRRAHAWSTVSAAALVAVASTTYGVVVLAQPSEAHGITVTVVQPNIEQAIKWDRKLYRKHLERHMALSREATRARRSDLIVWPESSVQGNLTLDGQLRDAMSQLASDTRSHFIVGSSQRPKLGTREFRDTHSLNTAYLISPDNGITGRYHKVRLLPFGEYLPFRDILPWPQRYKNRLGEYAVGDSYTLFNIKGTRLATPICWEMLFPDVIRTFAAEGAHLMVNIGNEAWFGDTTAPYQSFAINVFRAVENRVPIVRAYNTGVSGFIDSYGRITGVVSQNDRMVFVEDYLTEEVLPLSQRSLYTRFGDAFAYLLMILLGAQFFTAVFVSRKSTWPQPAKKH